jgi:phosphocarrier protein HPr
MPVIESVLEVNDPIGLHARPASQIVKAVKASGLEVKLGRKNGELLLVNSPLQLMALKVKTGEKLQVVVTAESEDQANSLLQALQELLKG